MEKTAGARAVGILILRPIKVVGNLKRRRKITWKRGRKRGREEGRSLVGAGGA